jgi:hypothetical protein
MPQVPILINDVRPLEIAPGIEGPPNWARARAASPLVNADPGSAHA